MFNESLRIGPNANQACRKMGGSCPPRFWQIRRRRRAAAARGSVPYYYLPPGLLTLAASLRSQLNSTNHNPWKKTQKLINVGVRLFRTLEYVLQFYWLNLIIQLQSGKAFPSYTEPKKVFYYNNCSSSFSKCFWYQRFQRYMYYCNIVNIILLSFFSFHASMAFFEFDK